MIPSLIMKIKETLKMPYRKPKINTPTVAQLNPRAISIYFSPKGYWCPIGMISAKRWKRMFDFSPAFIKRLEEIDNNPFIPEILARIKTPIKSLPSHLLPALLKIASMRSFILFVNQKKIDLKSLDDSNTIPS